MAASSSSTGQGVERLGMRRRRLACLSVGLLAPYLDALVDTMTDEGYRRGSILGRVHWAHAFGGYAAAQGIADVSRLSDALAAEFVAARQRLGSLSPGQRRTALRHLRGGSPSCDPAASSRPGRCASSRPRRTPSSRNS
jgi:hypothetical protein